ncbi:MAG TPA: hypothetical protein VFT90_12820, partial [Chryseosolibacter sp.]|nr:hypothetical protein [Chryseosolibacter sp.]
SVVAFVYWIFWAWDSVCRRKKNITNIKRTVIMIIGYGLKVVCKVRKSCLFDGASALGMKISLDWC